MNILVIGGTRYFGVHMVKALISKEHEITIVTRGNRKDNFGDKVKRIYVDRTNGEEIYEKFSGKYYDVICDNIAYSSNDVKYLLEVVKYGKYILTSTLSVYDKLHKDIKEEEFNPLTYPLNWCGREDFPYDEVKRQAECALFQVYNGQPKIAVRFPFVIGEDDYTKRLFFYIEHCIKEIPMYIDNLDEEIAFISSKEAGEFLAWLVDKDYSGIVNACNKGTITLAEVLNYVREKTGCTPILLKNGKEGPYNRADSFSMDTKEAESLGFYFLELRSYIYTLLDFYIEEAKK